MKSPPEWYLAELQLGTSQGAPKMLPVALKGRAAVAPPPRFNYWSLFGPVVLTLLLCMGIALLLALVIKKRYAL